MAPEDNPADEAEPTEEEWDAYVASRSPQGQKREAIMSAIEGKYGAITTTGKQFHPGEPVFILRATDPLAPAEVEHYATECALAGCSEEHVAACHEHARRIEAWQAANPHLVKKLPD
jgi:hypothetical protein